MKNIVLLDFDGTITVRDTTRYLIFALLRMRPWLIFRILGHILIFLFKSNERIQELKNHCIGMLLNGLDNENLSAPLSYYRKSVQNLLRPRIIELIQEKAKNGDLILVITASPDFAVRYVLNNLPVIVIGTKFKMNEERYTEKIDGISCYGLNKPRAIAQWAKSQNFEARYIEAWSDAESDLPMMLLAQHRYWVCKPNNLDILQQLDKNGVFLQLD